jgi:hypothetical protein
MQSKRINYIHTEQKRERGHPDRKERRKQIPRNGEAEVMKEQMVAGLESTIAFRTLKMSLVGFGWIHP